LQLHTPLHELTAAAGATFGETEGWLLPLHYGDAALEYHTAVSDIAVFDVSHRGYVEAKGPEAGKFLHNLCTNDVLKLPLGAGCEAFLTTSQAKIAAYVVIYHAMLPHAGELYLVDAGPGMGEPVLKHLDRFLISEQLELADRTKEFAQLHLAGPRAPAVLEGLTSSSNAAFQEYQHECLPLAGFSCQVRRRDILGLPGYDIVIPQEQAAFVWKALLTAGARPAGTAAYEVLRIEAGSPVYGRDIDETNLPQEVGRVERTISFTKGCYIGQETVARIRTYGHVNRSLVGLKLSTSTPVASGTKLLRDGKEVGQVTSSVVSPRMGTVIGLGYARRGNQEPGTILQLDGSGSQAEVASLPFPLPGANH
jgi:folate-binding protein YgfZ